MSGLDFVGLTLRFLLARIAFEVFFTKSTKWAFIVVWHLVAVINIAANRTNPSGFSLLAFGFLVSSSLCS